MKTRGLEGGYRIINLLGSGRPACEELVCTKVMYVCMYVCTDSYMTDVHFMQAGCIVP